MLPRGVSADTLPILGMHKIRQIVPHDAFHRTIEMRRNRMQQRAFLRVQPILRQVKLQIRGAALRHGLIGLFPALVGNLPRVLFGYVLQRDHRLRGRTVVLINQRIRKAIPFISARLAVQVELKHRASRRARAADDQRIQLPQSFHAVGVDQAFLFQITR